MQTAIHFPVSTNFWLADTITNAYSTPYVMFSNPSLGFDPYGGWVEVDGLYYSVARKGAVAYEGSGPLWAWLAGN